MINGINKYFEAIVVKSPSGTSADSFGNVVDVYTQSKVIMGRIRQLNTDDKDSGRDVKTATHRLYCKEPVDSKDRIVIGLIEYEVVGVPNNVMGFGQLWQVELWQVV